jgi:hypothetical protein
VTAPLGTGPIWHPEVIEPSTEAAVHAIAAAETLLIELSWQELKDFFLREAPKLL